MEHGMFNKSLVVIILIFFIVSVISPSLSGNTLKSNTLSNETRNCNSKYFESCNKPDNPNDILTTEDTLYVRTDEFGLREYNYLNSNLNYDSDNLQSLNLKKIERPQRVITTKYLDNNIELKILGNILYVGGEGPNNYTSIQDAIDNASNEDTVFVYDDSSPYYENIIIDKTIQLIGENSETTIINGSNLDIFLDTVNITANNVNLFGFSLINNLGYYYQSAILVTGNYVTISNCYIYNNNWVGVSLLGSSYSQIYGCELYNNLISIYLIDSSNNVIMDCLCHENSEDILLYQSSHYNQIINCTCIGNTFSGIHVQRSSGNQIFNCTIQNGVEGIGMAYAPDTKLRGNVLINNFENFGIGSTSISDFYCDIDTSNTINGKPIYYWIEHHDEQVPNDAAFIGLISCTNITVTNFEITYNFQGIVCAGTSNSTIENCTFRNNGGHGVFFLSSSKNIIRNSTCRNSFFSGIYLIHLSNSNIIYNNNFIDIQVRGLWIEDSPNNQIYNHIISNALIGISLDNSANSLLRDNNMVNCGLSVDGNVLTDYINDVDTSNKVNGKTLYYYINENGIIVPSDAGEVILVNCSNCNISNLDLSNGTVGVELAFSSNNIIVGNTINSNNLVAIDLDCSGNNFNIIERNIILENNYGIDVDVSDYNTIKDNLIHDNGESLSLDSSNNNNILENDIANSYNGIYLSNSNSNKINSNNIEDCRFTSIYLLYSKNNILKENLMVNCGLIVYGTSLSQYINDVDTSNKVNGKTLYYYMNENGKTVPNDAGEVILINCENCIVANLELSDQTVGVELAYSNYNNIEKNTLKNNKYAGIYLESSNYNFVKTNNIENSGYGISMQLANTNNIKNNKIKLCYYGLFVYLSNSNNLSGNDISYNTYGFYLRLPSNSNNIHYNNLILNGFNAWDENENTNFWDDGKKGNYWWDYTTKYPNARKIWLKGIWDIPYEIPSEENQDRYPLISPHISSKEKRVNMINNNFLEKVIDFIIRLIMIRKLVLK